MEPCDEKNDLLISIDNEIMHYRLSGCADPNQSMKFVRNQLQSILVQSCRGECLEIQNGYIVYHLRTVTIKLMYMLTIPIRHADIVISRRQNG